MAKSFHVFFASVFVVLLMGGNLFAQGDEDKMKSVEKAAVKLKKGENGNGSQKADGAGKDSGAAAKADASADKKNGGAQVSKLDDPAPKKEPGSLGSRITKSILLYIPNRILDVTDIFTISAGAGPEFSLHVKGTNYAQLGGTHGDKYFLCKGFHRQYGGGGSEGWSYGLGVVGAEYRLVENTFGTANSYFVNDEKLGLMSRELEAYEDKRTDFWGLGVRLGWLINTEIFVHPVEIADVVTGIFCVDLMNDDFEETAAARVE